MSLNLGSKLWHSLSAVLSKQVTTQSVGRAVQGSYDTICRPVACYDTACRPVARYETACRPVACYDTVCRPVACYDTPCRPVACYDTPCRPVACFDTPCRPVACYDTVRRPVACYDTVCPPVACYDTVRRAVAYHDTACRPVACYNTPCRPVACYDSLSASSMIWHSLSANSMLWHSLSASSMLWHSLSANSMLWHSPSASTMLWHSLSASSMLWHTLSASSMLWHTLSAPCCQVANYKSRLQPAETQFQLRSTSHAARAKRSFCVRNVRQSGQYMIWMCVKNCTIFSRRNTALPAVPSQHAGRIWTQTNGTICTAAVSVHNWHSGRLGLLRAVIVWFDLKAIVQPEDLYQWKISMTPLGIEPATFRFVAQCPQNCQCS